MAKKYAKNANSQLMQFRSEITLFVMQRTHSSDKLLLQHCNSICCTQPAGRRSGLWSTSLALKRTR